MKDKLDQHLDQKLRESYDALQAKAPEGLWERLEEQLPDPVDALLDQKLKDGYATLPAAKAPQALWSSILDELPQDPDALLDQKLKESYDQQYLAAPQKVWQAVNRQLNIDKTWLRVEATLNGRARWAKRLLRSLQALAAVALILLLLRTCGREEPRQPLAVTQSFEPVTVVAPATASPSKPSVTRPVGQELDEPSSAGDASPRAATAASESAAALPSGAPLPQEVRGGADASAEGLAVPAASTGLEPVVLADGPVEAGATPVADANERPSHVMAQKEDGQVPEASLAATTAVAVLTPDALEVESIELERPVIEPTETTLTNPPSKTPKWTVGVFLALNATTLLNNETRSGFRPSSFTINYYGVATNYGLWGRYEFSPRHAVLAEYSINADNRQAYGTYEKAKFQVKEWVMKYSRVGLAYQWTFLNNKQPKRFNNQLTAQAGVYGGWLHSARLLYDGKAVYDRIGEYRSFDFGLKLAMGHEIRLDNIVFGYGIRSDIGLANIFKGNAQQAANENHTNLLHLGGYISLGYRF